MQPNLTVLFVLCKCEGDKDCMHISIQAVITEVMILVIVGIKSLLLLICWNSLMTAYLVTKC